MTFSGSYAPADVTFLLTPLQLESTPVEEKERLIQSGRRHYSEMIGVERAPDATYLGFFEAAMAREGARFARDVAALALALAARASCQGRQGRELVLVSLARAGTPVGVLLRRALQHLGRRVRHYSISIIRDRGIDTAALDLILAEHEAGDLVFVDGWTGKGAIADELHASGGAYAAARGVSLDTSLAVVADLGGCAGLAATHDDYLIPSSILNAVVSGLVSRTIRAADASPGALDGCVYYEAMVSADRSRWFVDALMAPLHAALGDGTLQRARRDEAHSAVLRARSEQMVDDLKRRFDVTDRNRIKPGIGEATRALLRRVPERLLLQSAEGVDLEHLRLLAARRGVPVEIEPALPHRAVTLIRSLGADS